MALRQSLSLPKPKRRVSINVILMVALSPAVIGLFFASQQAQKLSRNAADRPLGLHAASRKPSNAICRPNISECCVLWSTPTDKWWTQRYDYRPGPQNTTHTCFARIPSSKHVAFLSNIHKQQWRRDCRDAVQTFQISSGYAAALMSIARSFYAAVQHHQLPFAVTRHHDQAIWNFVSNDTRHWAYCASRDIHCYFLPLTHCPPIVGKDTASRGTKPSNAGGVQEFRWLRQYAFRPNHQLRRKLVEFQRQQNVAASTPCAALHVRRSDIAFGKGRRYAPVHEYLVRGNVSKGETVVLLTDDESTIDEVNRYLRDDYRWVYLKRPRFRGAIGGFEGFVPSLDPAMEVLSILTEVQLAGRCSKLVHGKSGFVDLLVEELESNREISSQTYELFYVDTQQDKRQQPKMDPADRVVGYLQSIADYYAALGIPDSFETNTTMANGL